MSEILFILAGAILGVDFGWAPLQGGEYEAILQIEPEVVAELARPGGQQEITSDVPRRLWTARRLRITSGKSEIPRDGLPRAAREADESTFENESIVYLDAPALGALSQGKDVVFTLPASVKGVKRYRIVAGEQPRQPASTPPNGSTTGGNPLRDPPPDSATGFTNPPYRDDRTAPAAGTTYPPPTDRTQSDPSRVLPGPERRGGTLPADDYGWSDRWDPPAADPWPGAANAYPRDQYPPPSQAQPYQDPYGRGDPYAQAGDAWRDDPRRNPNYGTSEDPRTWPPGYDPRYAAADRFYGRPGSADPRTWDELASRTPPRGYEPLDPANQVPATGQQAKPAATETRPAPPSISISLPRVTTTTMSERPHFWPLTFSLLGFFAALGGVIFLGWMNYNFRRQYQHLLSRLRNRRVLATS